MPHDPALIRLSQEALAARQRGDLGAALLAYRRLQARFPDFPDAWANACAILAGMGRFEDAVRAGERALELDPDNTVALLHTAEARRGLMDAGGGLRNYVRLLELDPGHVLAMSRIADVLDAAGLYGEALACYDTALRREPENAILYALRAQEKRNGLDFAGAEADYRRALELEPDDRDARLDLAYPLLITGRYGEAWGHIKASGGRMWAAGRHDFGKPDWKGGPLEGGTLLVYAHAGHICGSGDIIQLSRYFPRIKEKYGCRVALHVPGQFRRLFDGLPGMDRFVAAGEPLPCFDAAVPVWELFPALGVDLSDLPPPAALAPIARACPAAPAPELDLDGPAGARFKVGLVWGGVSRRLDPRLLDCLADTPGAERIAWYGLQRELPGRDPGPPPDLPGFIDLSPRINDFMDTAHLAMRLDLVVTVDTSVAHLAGSLGVPTAVLLTPPPDWRWGLADTTPWYPSVRLVRQRRRGDQGQMMADARALIAGDMERRLGT
jgi:predicted TPR repeat methyltransferase